MIPRVALTEIPKTWQVVAADVAEVNFPGMTVKMKFAVLVDIATKFVTTHILKVYPTYALDAESAEQLISAFATSWLSNKPKPVRFIADSGKGFDSKEYAQFCEDVQIGFLLTFGQAPWAHGVAEGAVQRIKRGFIVHAAELGTCDPSVLLALATRAANACDDVHGYCSGAGIKRNS